MKKVNQDPFSNGTECDWWMERNCRKCIKSPRMIVSGLVAYTKCRCAIHRDIESRMWNDEPIAQRTIDITRMSNCPYRREHWPKRKRKSKTAGLPSLFESN